MHRCVDCGSFNTAQVPATSRKPRKRGGPVPYGFVKVDGELKWDDTDLGTGSLLLWLMRHHANGLSYRDLEKAMAHSESRAPSGGPWTHGIIARVVRQGKNLSHLIPFQAVI